MRSFLVLLAAALLVVQPVMAQMPCPGTWGNPVVSYLGSSQIGSTFTVTLSNAYPGSTAILIVGEDINYCFGLPLPLSMSVFVPGSSCLLGVCPEVLIASQVSGFGLTSTSLPVPTNPFLIGFVFYFQWAVVEPSGLLAMSGVLGVQILP
jgi:hypothetical protein